MAKNAAQARQKPGPARIQFLTVAEASKQLALNEHTIRRLIWSGQLKATRFGRAVRVAEGELTRFVAAAQSVAP